jgi:two-component system, chemotaxis family, CheB/CheR fusion protein
MESGRPDDMPDTDPQATRPREAEEAQWRIEEGERLLVCGIGASAGGLAAFERFLRALPPDSGLGYVLVQHLDPEHESILAEILGRAASIPVAFAEDAQTVERDHVYVMPRDAGLVIEGGKLRLIPSEPRSSRLPINTFLTSLAEDLRESAIGVVLSGTGSDGALGISAVKQYGGATFAQLPSETVYDSMPQAAIATGMVEQVLPVEQIPVALAKLAARRRKHPGESGRGEEEGLREVFDVLKQKTGHDFGRYKRTTILRRLQRRTAATGTATLGAYVTVLAREPDEIRRLTDDLMINVTSFFRDDEAFQTLERVAIPGILKTQPRGEARAWVAGCSSGEEAYSIAMLFREQPEGMQCPAYAKVFATDIDASALAEARRARYTSVVEQQVSRERVARFFVKHGESYTVSKEVRDLCIFTTHDLLTDPPFSRMDLVSCRNLLIYLEAPYQKRVIELLHYALRPGGYLLLGKAEIVDGRDLELFEAVDKTAHLYRRRDVERRPSFTTQRPRGRALPLEMAPLVRPGGPDVRSAADRSRSIVLEEYAPPSVVVDSRGEIRYYWGTDLGSYLPPQAGPPVTNLMHLVRKELKVELSGTLHNAARQGGPVTYTDLAVTVDGVERRLNLVVRPLPPTEKDRDELFLVIFQEFHAGPAADGVPLDAYTVEQHRRLKSQLENTQARLQFTVDELENANEALRDSNEQLQSLNEELHSSNEELQTSQEELQSVNEELHTVNAELNKKLGELEIFYGDLQNLFQSTQIATILLDRQLKIARFTPEAVTVFRLVDGDVGRPLTDFAARFDAKGLAEEVERVLRTLESVERTIRTVQENRFFLMRMHPYRTPSNVIAGVVISFIDVTKLKEAEAALRDAVEERERAERALQEADHRKDEFLAILSHELRNPLAPIRNSLHLLETSLAAPDVARRALQIIDRQVGYLTRIVDDLLDVTRISRGTLELRNQRLDLRGLVERTVEDHRTLFSTRGLSLEATYAPTPLWVEGDPTRLAQIVGNLLQNSAKFTPTGGSVILDLDAVAGVAELRIRDSGIGIDPAMLPRLFLPFTQADTTLVRSLGGLGLGLALVKELVELHGGTVEVFSSGVGAGAEFVVRVPLTTRSAVAPEPVPPAASRPRRILVIEDNVDGAESLREVLEMDGHTVAVALDGAQGLAKGREFGPEVVLCDIGLPGLDGYEVAQALRNDPALRGAFLIAMTGYATPEDQQRVTNAGFDAYLAKPPSFEQIRAAIAHASGPDRLPG